MTGEILDKVGETENIGEDNDVIRLSPNRLRINMDGYHWIVSSNSPITVTTHDEEEYEIGKAGRSPQ